MGDRDAMREVLFRHSDSRPCRLLWEAIDDSSGTPALDVRDYLEVLRVTGGAVCLVAPDDEADLYVRWIDTGGSYVFVAFWPPWGVVDAGTATRSEIETRLDDRDGIEPVHFEETPFANDGPAADLSGWL
ncbi:hypothetical protein [Halorientalis salina]|uniref:hypothetical protein n=1 Tax=Halorientalis salina TaxID=2932266 RepID=UPI0010AC8157|nr:hypothetical protein [Halorientalis salina]